MNWCCAMMCVYCHFQKYILWSKRMLNTHGRYGGSKKLIGDQVQVFPTSPTRPPRLLWPKDGKRSRGTRFGRWFRTAWLGQLATDATTSYGVRLGRSLYGWKGNFIEIPMALVSYPNSIWVDGNHWNKWTSKICEGAASPPFGSLARVSCRSPWGHVLGLEHDPHQVLVVPLPSHILP
jgi:hypothetical protein